MPYQLTIRPIQDTLRFREKCRSIQTGIRYKELDFFLQFLTSFPLINNELKQAAFLSTWTSDWREGTGLKTVFVSV